MSKLKFVLILYKYIYAAFLISMIQIGHWTDIGHSIPSIHEYPQIADHIRPYKTSTCFLWLEVT